jgi:hypothetical protein
MLVNVWQVLVDGSVGIVSSDLQSWNMLLNGPANPVAFNMVTDFKE